MSTLTENSAGNILAPCQGISAPFYHSPRGKHCYVMTTHWFCAVQGKRTAKPLLTATRFPSIPWSFLSIYSLCFFSQGLSILETAAF